MSATLGLFVKSHVARDLLQNAGMFKTDKLVVWEYVANGLQYTNPGTNPVAKVTLDSKKKRIAVQDNGRGMDWAGLHNFFVMHGENLDRKEGRVGRGMFGTGKSAAFGIADVLRITTVRNGKRSKVELKRSEIERMKSDDPISVTVLEKEVATSATNGTLVEIEGVHLRSLDQAAIIHYIERHLARWPKNTTVFVNNHECEFNEPPVAAEYRFTPEENSRQLLGDVELVIKVSKTPLDEDVRGVSVYSSGVWHETTLAGSEGREMSQYIFGEIDVPKLDDDKSPIAPFDVSRSMRLNAENEVVRAIHVFVGTKVEAVRRSLFDAERKRKTEEEAKKLAQQATEIARVINEDFEAFRQRVAKVRTKTSGAEIEIMFVQSVVSAHPGFGWLDEPSGWFWLKSTARNALLNQIQKVIAVAPRIHVAELRAGVSRHHRREGFAPPQRVLLALCSQADGYTIEGNSVLATPPLDYREVISDTESIIVDVLLEHGPVMQRPKLEEICLRKGLHRDSFYIHLTYSPVIARYARGVYGLPGAQIPPGLAESMVESRRKTRVLADYGWLPDGRIFLSYKLSVGCLSNGIVSVPRGMKSYLQGAYELLIADGGSAGRLVVKDTQAWGLGPFFRRRGGEPGDFFRLVFDTKQKVASVRIGEIDDTESL